MKRLKPICGTVSSAQIQGPRDRQEDFLVHVDFPFGHLIAVMDGHGGQHTARYCAERIPTLFNPKQPTEVTLRSMSKKLAAEARKFHSGSTLSIACILEQERRVITSVIGDSPIIVLDADEELHRSVEHNVRTNIPERTRAITRGGVYVNGYIRNPKTATGLQMSRALGDVEMGNVILREAETSSFSIGPKCIVMVGSDGILDPSHQDEEQLLDGLIKEARRGSATKIVKWRESLGLDDNTSIVIWKPKK